MASTPILPRLDNAATASVAIVPQATPRPIALDTNDSSLSLVISLAERRLQLGKLPRHWYVSNLIRLLNALFLMWVPTVSGSIGGMPWMPVNPGVCVQQAAGEAAGEVALPCGAQLLES